MTVTLAPGLNTSPIGFGCMALSHVYGGTTNDQARHTLEDALDAGITFLDTADVYGEPRPDATGPAGTNEEMLAPFVARHRDQLQIATKFGITGALTVEKRSEPPTSGGRSMCAQPVTHRCGVWASRPSTSTTCTAPTRTPPSRRPSAR